MTFGREIAPEAAGSMMDFAWQAGWGMFDSASAYGSGASERVVGEWLRRRAPVAGRPLVATKILPPYAPESLQQALRASRERLQVETLDVLYLHQWHDSALRPEVLTALQAAVERGEVRALGVSNFSAEQLEQVLTRQARAGFHRFSYLQNNHNYAVSGFDPATHALCVREGVHRVGYSPLGAGYLTGKYRDGVPPGTRFDLIPGHQKIYFTPAAQRRLAHLTTIATRGGFTPAELALAWAAHHPAVSMVLVGGRSTAALELAIHVAKNVSPAILRQLDESREESAGISATP